MSIIETSTDSTPASLRVKYSENPFLAASGLPEVQTKKRPAGSSIEQTMQVGKSDPAADVATDTAATLTFTQREDKDSEEFVKIYTNHLKAWFDLSRPGQRVFVALLASLQRQIRKDEVHLTPAFVEQETGMSDTAAFRGILNLIQCRLIAPSAAGPHFYFINPHFIFNGDRLVFMREVRRKRAEPPATSNATN